MDPRTGAIQPKILVVDDSATNRALLRSILRSEGFTVEECESGAAAVEACAGSSDTIVLLDVMMPELDGIATCRMLRERHAKEDLPVLMVTTRMDSGNLAEGFEAGANDYITKPVDRTILLSRLHHQLSLYRSHRELQRSRAALEQAVSIQRAMGDTLREAVMISDASGNVVYSNQALTSACGGETLATSSAVFGAAFGGASAAACEECARQAAIDPAFTQHREIETGHSVVRHLEIQTRPVTGGDGTLRIWVWSDVTKTRELERRSQQEVRLDTVSTFAGGVAHNFNNLMGVMLGATDRLAHVASDPVATRCIDLVRRAVASGRKLTDRMMLLRGFLTVKETDAVFLRSALDSMVDRFRAQQGDRIRFMLECEDALPPAALGIRVFDVIFAQVLSNACDAIGERGTVSIQARSDVTAHAITVSIEDDGCGMRAEVLDRVFEPFFSTKNLDTANGISTEGNGLGMWAVYNAVKLAQGDIAIESRPGAGTAVSITLPTRG